MAGAWNCYASNCHLLYPCHINIERNRQHTTNYVNLRQQFAVTKNIISCSTINAIQIPYNSSQ